MFNFFKNKTKYQNVSDKEKNLSDFLNCKAYWDDQTIITQDNSLMQVIKLEGISFETTDDEDLDISKNIRNNLFKNMTSGEVTLYFHIIRKKQNDINQATEEKIGLENFALYTNNLWKKKHDKNCLFRTRT